MASPDQQNFYTDLFAYTFYLASIASGASAVANIQLDTDSDFEWVKSSIWANGADTQSGMLVPEITAMIVDQGNSRQLFNIALPVGIIAGLQGLPFINPTIKTFKGGATVNATFSNISAATTYTNFYLTLWGRKIFRYS